MENKVLKWGARSFALIYVLLLSSFSFVSIGNWLLFFISLIPTALVCFLTFIAWKDEKKGGIGFIVLVSLFTVGFNTFKSLDAFLVISVPVLLIGSLFLLKVKFS